MTDVEAIVQGYYGDRPVLQRIEDAVRAAGVDPETPSHRDLWPFDQLHSRGIVATREHAERARIRAGMYVLEIGCGLGGASRYLAAECGCRVAAIDLTPAFVEVARILTARCGLADRIEFRQANALALPFRDGTFDHVWSYAVTMNIADKEGLGREVARVLKPGGRFSCNEIAQGPGGAPVFPMPWATDGTSSFLVSSTLLSTTAVTPVQTGRLHSDQSKGTWKQFVGKAKKTWGRLIDDDWKVVEGRRDQLVGKIQERYGIAREEAERQVSEFERNHGDRAPWSRG